MNTVPIPPPSPPPTSPLGPSLPNTPRLLPPHTPNPLPRKLRIQVIAPVRQRAQLLADARAAVVGAPALAGVSVPFGPGVGDVDRVRGVVHGDDAEVGAGVAVVVDFAWGVLVLWEVEGGGWMEEWAYQLPSLYSLALGLVAETMEAEATAKARSGNFMVAVAEFGLVIFDVGSALGLVGLRVRWR